MLKVLLYGLATFMETGIGVWIFGQMFPKRSMETEKDKTVWKIILIILLYFTAYSFCGSYLENNIETKKTILIILLVLGGICLIPDCVVRLKRIRNFQSVLFFVMIVVLITCQYWTAYVSGNVIVLGNLYLPIFLTIFFRCTFIQSYIWEFLYLTNIGLLKLLYIITVCLSEKRKIGEYIYRQSMHSYSSGIYLLVISVVIILLLKLFRANKYAGDIFRDNQKFFYGFALAEYILLYFLLSMQNKILKIENLVIAIVVVSGVAVVLLILFTYFFVKSVNIEKNILEVKNRAIEQQYQELEDAYQKYRCIIHDQKHMLSFIQECIENRDLNGIAVYVADNQKKFRDEEKKFWTGINVLDKTITMKKRKMDALDINFELDASVDDTIINTTDLVIILSNLFDNAIDAAVKSKEKKICLKIKNINDVLMMKMWNTSTRIPDVKRGKFVTDKLEAEGHGWGIESVKRIVKRYDGNITFKYDSNFFQVTIILSKN